VDEQPFHHRLDVVRFPQRALDPGASASGTRDNQIAWADVAEPLAVEDKWHTGNEVRLADEKLAAPRNLDDDLRQT
jgi:hypothetical protein